ncbi:MAG TPA: lmo0937 family membrane protein [Candidatus Diapherotrites archaeon]|uniref:Lmo0937 family membrane protein n=1 Tax=Candidatus Iainarchaeum sp. TaxID=3101447 RepID=A0A7J4IYF6_9ARCH|nr:lmo0937 family membrane protein [Candidatus Diapherotrites archaeon]
MDTIWAIVVILVILWALGLIGSIGGSLINLLLAVALIIIVYRLSQGRDIATGR